MDTSNFKEMFTTDEVKQLRQRVAELEKERDEADRRAGAAERGYASYLDAAVARDSWLKKAKAQWGADSNVSFDVVWAEALAQKEQITTLKSALREAKEALEVARNFQQLPEHHLALHWTNEAIATITAALGEEK